MGVPVMWLAVPFGITEAIVTASVTGIGVAAALILWRPRRTGRRRRRSNSIGVPAVDRRTSGQERWHP